MLIAALLLAQAAPAACSATDAALPPPLAGWTKTEKTLTPGAALVVPAKPGPANAERPGGTASVTFTIKTAGTYRIGLDQGGWIDVRPAAGGAALTSVAHGHGPACSTIRKLVAFDLTAATYRLDLSGLTKPAARVMLVQGK